MCKCRRRRKLHTAIALTDQMAIFSDQKSGCQISDSTNNNSDNNNDNNNKL